MIGCRAAMTKTLQIAAMAPRGDVTFPVGPGQYAFHLANGVAWYYDTSSSWGFFSPLDSVSRTSCDTSSGAFPELRMCWHTGAGNLGYSQGTGGYRCGTNVNLNNSTAVERVVFQAP
jgi:hypothetical protein